MSPILPGVPFPINPNDVAYAGLGQPSPWQLGLQQPATPVMENLIWFHDFLLWLITAIALLRDFHAPADARDFAADDVEAHAASRDRRDGVGRRYAGREDEAALEHRAQAFDLRVTVVVFLVGRRIGHPHDEQVHDRDEQVAERVSALVVTRGEQGAEIYTSKGRFDIPVVRVDQVVDPTGCGDAFRAGMLYGLTNDMDWMTIGRLSSLMGSIKIASQGGQNHTPTLAEIQERFRKEFGYSF